MPWNHGYNTDLGYTYGYYREQDPAWLDLCALIKGAAPPSLLTDGKLCYLELGCGQGVNLCLIAAVHPHIDFVGIDFNPALRKRGGVFLSIKHASPLRRGIYVCIWRYYYGRSYKINRSN